MFDERDHNYPQGYKEGPHCPNSTLVEICNSLAGNNVTPREFCTEVLENPVYSRGVISTLKSGDYSPRTSCSTSCLKLIDQLRFVKNNPGTPPDINEVQQKLDNTKNLDKKIETLESFKDIMNKYEERNNILNRWRSIIFDITCSTTNDIQNWHYRRLNSDEDLLEDEIIGKVEKFTEALKEIVGYKEKTFLFLSDGAKNCKQSPHSHHVGSYD